MLLFHYCWLLFIKSYKVSLSLLSVSFGLFRINLKTTVFNMLNISALLSRPFLYTVFGVALSLFLDVLSFGLTGFGS